MFKPKACATCGNQFNPNSGPQRYCSIGCNPYKSKREVNPDTGRRKIGPVKKPRLEKVCPGCASVFLTRWARQICCSKTCARKVDNEKNGPRGWKGGRYKHACGYIKVLAKGHPHADDNGYVMEHRIVMEEMIGRKLEPYERVHHKNGHRDDNRPENLELWILKGRSKKDPAGQRVSDLIEHAVEVADCFGIHPPAARRMLESLLLNRRS